MKNVKLTEYIPELDDFELKPHYDFDYRKSKPNPFVKKSQVTRRSIKKIEPDGEGIGAKRSAKTSVVNRHTITLHQADAAYLRKLDKSLSHAIRKLILMQRAMNKSERS